MTETIITTILMTLLVGVLVAVIVNEYRNVLKWRRTQLLEIRKKQAELITFDEELQHYANQRIKLDLDDGVKVNYGKFGNLLAEVKSVTGKKPKK